MNGCTVVYRQTGDEVFGFFFFFFCFIEYNILELSILFVWEGTGGRVLLYMHEGMRREYAGVDGWEDVVDDNRMRHFDLVFVCFS